MDRAEVEGLAGRRVVVWGNGREGQAAVRALAGVPLKRLDVVDDVAQPGVLSGAAADAALSDAEVVIKSPGISRYDPRVQRLIHGGVQVTGGSALWMAAHHDRTIAVTGSKGKSTTSALIHHLLTAVGVANTYGGNIGVPLLDLEPADRYVVELSSYQCAELDTSPEVAVLTALFPEHLNWHGTAERYYADKLNLIANGPATVVYNAGDLRLNHALLGRLDGIPQVVPVQGSGADGVSVNATDFLLDGQVLFPRSQCPLVGDHNAVNVCLALSAVRAVGVDLLAVRDSLAEGLRTFEPLPHRLKIIAEQDGIRFVDDSLSTAPQAAIAALGAFPDGPVALLVGGQDRGVDYEPLADHLRTSGRVVHVIGLPESGPRILALLAGIEGVTTEAAQDLTEAVRLARRALADSRDGGGTVLLSPAAPSYGVFKDHRDRGAAFAAAVEATA